MPVRIASSVGSPHTLAACAERYPGEAEEHRVSERQQPAEAQQQVEGAGEEREAERLHQEYRVDDEGRHQQDREHHDEPDAVVARLPDGILDGGAVVLRGLRHRPSAVRRALAGGS
jgi:hypothetical protein